MKKQIVQVSVLQSSKVAAGIYFVTAIPAALLVGLATSMTSQGVSLVMLVILPLAYAFFGFLGSLLAACIYNLVAARIGGFEFTTEEVGDCQHG
jgi:hypothetical protein